MMNTSETIGELAAALAKAQGEIQNPAKDTENPFFHSKYADLASGLNVIRPALSKHGLSIVQVPRMAGEYLMLDTRIIHASGQWIEGTYPVIKYPAEPQKVGSAMTFVRRYSGFAMVGIAGESEDDDGNEANKKPIEQPRNPPKYKPRNEAHPRQIEAERYPDSDVVTTEAPADFPGDQPSVPVTDAISRYCETFRSKLDSCKTYNGIAGLWKAETKTREFVGIADNSPIWSTLHNEWAAKGKEIAARNNSQ